MGQSSIATRGRVTALFCVLFVVTMIGASFAAVPLYDLFCRVTGFGGTPSVALSAAPGMEISDETVTVRFDANVAPGLPWTFTPDQRTMEVRLGEVVTATYTIANTSREPTVATAVYNVTPLQTGGYFTKIQCFCFDAQPLGPSESLSVPVVFYVHPDYAADPDTRDASVITLSYTFFDRSGNTGS